MVGKVRMLVDRLHDYNVNFLHLLADLGRKGRGSVTTGLVAGSPRDDAVQNLIDPSLKRFRESDGRPVLQFFVKGAMYLFISCH